MSLREKLDRQQRAASITGSAKTRKPSKRASRLAGDDEGGPPPEVQKKIDDRKEEDKGDDSVTSKECAACGGTMSDDGKCHNCDEGGAAAAGYGIDDEDDEDFDLDGFDLSDITGVEDEGLGYEDDALDAVMGESDHEIGPQGGTLMIDDPPPMPRDEGMLPLTDESEAAEGAFGDEDDLGDMGPLMEDDPSDMGDVEAGDNYDDDDECIEGDDHYNDDGGGSGDHYNDDRTAAQEEDPDSAGLPPDDMPEDEEDMTTAQWFENFVAAGIIDAALSGLPVTSKKEVTHSLAQKGYQRGAQFVRALAEPDFTRMQRTLLPTYRETDRVVAELRQGEAESQKIIARLAKGGKKKIAAQARRELGDAKARDIAEAKLDCPFTPMLNARVAAFRRRGTGVAPVRYRRQASNPKSVVAQAYLQIAQACTALVDAGKPKLAAKMFMGRATTDTVRAAQLVASKVNDNNLEHAVGLVADLIRVSTTVPELNPTVLDPKRPVPGSGAQGPMPDAGFTFGMDDQEVRKAIGLLGVDEEPEYLRWVASLPKDKKGRLDATGSVGCYEDSPGGTVREFAFADARSYLQSRMKRRAVLLVDPNDIEQVRSEDVRMLLQASTQEDPFYTVLIQGAPVGEIHLSDQGDTVNQADIRDVFVDEQVYGRGIADSIARMGAGPTLEILAYRPYVTSYNRAEEVDKIRGQAAEIAQDEIDRQVAERTANTIELMMLAHEGIRRNIYPVDDPLKFALYEQLKSAGVREASIDGIIEEAVNMPLAADGGETGERKAALSWYIQILAGKASEFQDMSPETLAAVSQQIVGAPVRMRTGAHPVSTTQSLKERLQAGSQHYTTIPDADGPRTNHGVVENLRAALNIGRRR